MKTIWKFRLEVADMTAIAMPAGAQILCVQEQDESPCIWALVDPSARSVRRTFLLFGTGHNVPDNPGAYIGTFQLDGGRLVFHLFEVEAL